MSRKFTPEEYQQFCALMRIVDDPTKPPEEQLGACRLVMMICTSAVPSPPHLDPEPYCPEWLDAFGRAHDLHKKLLRKQATKSRRAAAKRPRDPPKIEIVRDAGYEPKAPPLDGQWVMDVRLPGGQMMRRIRRS